VDSASGDLEQRMYDQVAVPMAQLEGRETEKLNNYLARQGDARLRTSKIGAQDERPSDRAANPWAIMTRSKNLILGIERDIQDGG